LGSNSRFFVAAAVELIVSNYSPEEGSPIRKNRDDLIRPILASSGVREVSHFAQYFERQWANLLMSPESRESVKPDGLPTSSGGACPDKVVRGPLPDVHRSKSATVSSSSEGQLIRASSAGRLREEE
jgi:hypothetical protein